MHPFLIKLFNDFSFTNLHVNISNTIAPIISDKYVLGEDNNSISIPLKLESPWGKFQPYRGQKRICGASHILSKIRCVNVPKDSTSSKFLLHLIYIYSGNDNKKQEENSMAENPTTGDRVMEDDLT